MNELDRREVRRLAEEIAEATVEKEIRKVFAKMELSASSGDPDYTTIVGWVRWAKSCPVQRAWVVRTALTVFIAGAALALWESRAQIWAVLAKSLQP